MTDLWTIAAIAAMALATYATRLAGFVLLAGFNPRGRLKAALDALPPAILISVIAPAVLLAGPAEAAAAAVTAVVAWFRLPLAVTIATGVVSVVVLRGVLS